jgi:hypothetical protein
MYKAEMNTTHPATEALHSAGRRVNRPIREYECAYANARRDSSSFFVNTKDVA